MKQKQTNGQRCACDSIEWRWKASNQVSTYYSKPGCTADHTVTTSTRSDDLARQKAYTKRPTKQAVAGTVLVEMTPRTASILETCGTRDHRPSTETVKSRRRMTDSKIAMKLDGWPTSVHCRQCATTRRQRLTTVWSPVLGAWSPVLCP